MRKYKSSPIASAPQPEVSRNAQAYHAAYDILFARPSRPQRSTGTSLSVDSEWLLYLSESSYSGHGTPIDYWQVRFIFNTILCGINIDFHI